MQYASTAMHIGVLTLRLGIETSDSLKDKRQVVRSLLQHIRNKFNVSASEVDDLALWRRATIGIAIVSNDTRFANQVLSQVVNHVESDPRAVLEDYALEMIPFSGGEASSNEDEETSEETLSDDFQKWFMADAKDA